MPVTLTFNKAKQCSGTPFIELTTVGPAVITIRRRYPSETREPSPLTALPVTTYLVRRPAKFALFRDRNSSMDTASGQEVIL